MLNIDGIESQTFFCIYLFHFITYKSFKGINETGVFFLFFNLDKTTDHNFNLTRYCPPVVSIMLTFVRTTI